MLLSKSHEQDDLIHCERVEELIHRFLRISPQRPSALFREFLPRGYRMTTLDSVPVSSVDLVVSAKVLLGMMITLYDDFADHPEFRNPLLLDVLYSLNLDRRCAIPAHLKPKDEETFCLARDLFDALKSALEVLPLFETLKPVLRFDIEMFYACNRYSELMTDLPEVRTLSEMKTLGPHNMGIVAAGTIDLMALENLNLAELSRCREIFLLGQRLARISNLIFTSAREFNEGDVTNEMFFHGVPREVAKGALLEEFRARGKEIKGIPLSTFGTQTFVEGLEALHGLHSSYEGRI